MLDPTDERFFPWVEDPRINYEHLHRYAFAAELVKGKKVLDLACGEGYGSHMLSRKAKSVIGIDIDEPTIKHAKSRYSRENLEFRQGSIVEIPIEGEKKADVIVCFEAIEHIGEHDKLLSEVKRLLKDDGLFIVSTPNKVVYTDEPDYHNPFHIKELYFDEFKSLLGNYFKNVRFLGQRIYAGSNLWGLSPQEHLSHKEFVMRRSGKEFHFSGSNEKTPLYFIALASDAELEPLLYNVDSWLADISDILLQDYQKQITGLSSTLQARDAQIKSLEENTEKRASRITELISALQSKDAQIQDLVANLEEKSSQVAELNSALQAKDAQIKQMEQGIVTHFLNMYQRTVESLLGSGTRRRYYYELGMAALRVILNEGWRSFWSKSREWLRQRRGSREGSTRPFDPHQAWAAQHELSEGELDGYRRECLSFQYRPKISIITPVYNTNKKWLRLAIESVLNQVYDNWELCLADGNSTKPHVRSVLQEYAKKDPRIKVKILAQNTGASGNSNEALSFATGEFVGFLDHDDELSPLALYEVAKLLNEQPEADFIYSDEVLMNRQGRAFYALYKPDFSLDYLLSHPYIAHFAVIRRKLVDEVNGFREEFVTSQDYDLFLRVISKTRRVLHIPHILYKWREYKASAGHKYKRRVMELGKKAVSDFLEREGIEGDVHDGDAFNFFRVKRRIAGKPKVSIIIPTRDRVDLLKRCIESIENKTDYRNYEVIIVDNLSQESETAEYLDYVQRQYNNYRVLKFEESFNYSRLNNFAAKHAEGEHLLLLNNDTEVISPEWVEAMLEHSQREEVACVGAKLLYPDRKIQHVGVVIGLLNWCEHVHKFEDSNDTGYMGHFISIRNYSAVTAACVMIKRKVFEELGGFDEKIRVGFGDVDFCLRAVERGYLNVFTPYAELYHHEAATRGQVLDFDPHPEDSKYYEKRWNEILENGDPYYNPNLPLDSYDISPYVQLRRHKMTGRTKQAPQPAHPSADISSAPGPSVSKPLEALLEICYSRPDLQQAFPEVARGEHQELIDWAATSGMSSDDTRRLLRTRSSWFVENASEEIKPLATLIEVYNHRADLQAKFPEVLLGKYQGLLDWAHELVAGGNDQSDPALKRLLPYKPWLDMIASLPPEHLRVRVHGAGDAISFLKVAMRCARDIQNVLKMFGRELYSFEHILDFGCGCGRVLRCFHDHPESCHLYGTDIDDEAISWCQNTIGFAQFTLNKGLPPLPYPAETFDLIMANSVFTHLNEEYQFEWLKELHRVAKRNAILILTTHGMYYEHRLSQKELRLFKEKGFFYRKEPTEGLPDFYGFTFHRKEYVAANWSKLFKIHAHLERKINGVQDAIVLEKVDSGVPSLKFTDFTSQAPLEANLQTNVSRMSNAKAQIRRHRKG